MMDPTSIVGLTIAIFDQLLKLGERTAELTSDIRAFDDDTKHLCDKINNEGTKTRALRQLLFEPCPVYDGRAMFEQFSEDAQDQIKLLLGQSVNILLEGHQLLQSRYGSSSSSTNSNGYLAYSPPFLSSPEINLQSIKSNVSQAAAASQRRSTRSPLLLLRWSLRDKKRTETIIRDFGNLNADILDHIKLLCLGSTFGVDLQHLEHLQSDNNSKMLGFDVDASLRLTMSGVQNNPSNLELPSHWPDFLQRDTPVDEQFAIVNRSGTCYLQENRYYTPFPQNLTEVDLRTRGRVNALASLLQQPKEQVFRIPRCIGWSFIRQRSQIAFLFEIPKGSDPQPSTLLKLLDKPDLKLPLGMKFNLAYGLAKCIAQLHMVRWVHESFRSENILFFPSQTELSHSPTTASEINFSQPWVLGFEFSRPELDFSVGFSDICMTRDVYRHPERQGEPQKPFNKLHDIYALGVVLLEIGLWEAAITLERNRFAYAKDPYKIRDRLTQQAERRLESKVGEKYRDVVLKCLSGNFSVTDDSKDDLKLQQAFRSQVVDVLGRAAENV